MRKASAMWYGPCVYSIKNTVDGVVYIGASLSCRERCYGHKARLRHGWHPNKKLQRAWEERGEESFVFATEERVEYEERESLPRRESAHIARRRREGQELYNAPNRIR
jgi:predicted GIY-YIG superfamily endonuclease